MLTGNQLRLLRQTRGWGQKELAGRMKIKQQRISALEKEDQLTEECTNKALAALRFTRETAFQFLASLPPFSGGGGAKPYQLN